jgi:hypothetical protein
MTNNQGVDSLITHIITAMVWVLNLFISGINTVEKVSTTRVQHSVGSKKNRQEYCNSNNNLLSHKVRIGDPLLNKAGPNKEEPKPYRSDEISWRWAIAGLFVNTFQFILGLGKYTHAAQVEPINKVGRNEKCPCSSGKKHKHCCIKNAA